MQQSTDEETPGFKDRERQPSNATHTRQTLGAVGRVASRVRNSSLSKLTKANSFLQRQREEGEAGVNESPWGVGISVATKVENNTSPKGNENDRPNISPRTGRRSDMVELSSPLSADQHSSSRLLEVTPQNSAKEEEWPRKARTNGLIGNIRLGSDRKAEKRTERASGVLGTAGAARGLVKSVSRFGFRGNDRKANSQGTLNDLTKAKSSTTIPLNELKESKPSREQTGNRTSDVGEESKHRASSANPPETEAIDARIRGFHLPGLRRGRTKQDDIGSKSKASEKLKMEVARTKMGVEKSRVKPGSPKINPDEKESPKNGPDSEEIDEGKRTRNRKSFKDPEQKSRKSRGNWFGLSGDSGDSQVRGTLAQTWAKSRDRRQRSSADQDPEGELGHRTSARASKDLAEMEDFAIDEYFDSEEDNMETGSAPRSMVDDDFITYQTGKGKKAQGNRSKSRMKPQS